MQNCDFPDFLFRTFRRGICTVVMWIVHNYLLYQENDVVRCVVYRDNNIFVMEVTQMIATFGSLNIYVAGVPIGLFIF